MTSDQLNTLGTYLPSAIKYRDEILFLRITKDGDIGYTNYWSVDYVGDDEGDSDEHIESGVWEIGDTLEEAMSKMIARLTVMGMIKVKTDKN